MIQIRETFPTKAEAEIWAARYKSEYHPAGYGTRLTISEAPDGQWIVSGHRYSSCD
jgi:hypothetical protein